MAVELRTAESVESVLTCPSMEDQGQKKFASKLMLLKNAMVIDFTNFLFMKGNGDAKMKSQEKED